MTTKTTRTPAETFRLLGTTTTVVVNRIMRAWECADCATRAAGASWYLTARVHADTIAESAGIPVEYAAAVITHLSPRTSWARNVAGAYALVETGHAPSCIEGNQNRARAALASDAPLDTFGPAASKTHAFALNILGDTDAVTVDVWAYRVAMGNHDDCEKILARKGTYDAIAHAYRLAARRAGVTPAVMQATTWIVARNGRSE